MCCCMVFFGLLRLLLLSVVCVCLRCVLFSRDVVVMLLCWVLCLLAFAVMVLRVLFRCELFLMIVRTVFVMLFVCLCIAVFVFCADCFRMCLSVLLFVCLGEFVFADFVYMDCLCCLHVCFLLL